MALQIDEKKVIPGLSLRRARFDLGEGNSVVAKRLKNLIKSPDPVLDGKNYGSLVISGKFGLSV